VFKQLLITYVLDKLWLMCKLVAFILQVNPQCYSKNHSVCLLDFFLYMLLIY
jgi:hypothetical protein